MRRAVALAFALGTAGCYHATGLLRETHDIRSEAQSSKTETAPEPAKSGVYVRVAFVDDTLRLFAERQSWCSDTTTTVYARTKVGSRELPPSHKVLLGAGVGLLAGGATAALIGHSMMADGESVRLGGPSTEKKYDQGRMLFPLGLISGGFGALMVGSETYDLIAAGSFSEPMAPETKTTTEERVCGREPAAMLSLRLEAAGVTATTTTDEKGGAVVRLDIGAVADFPYRGDFFTVTCPVCKPTPVSLPMQQSARFVIRRGQRAEINHWMNDNPGASETVSVRDALASIEADERRRSAEGDYRQAEEKLKAGDLDAAARLAEKCLSLAPRHESCTNMLSRAHERIAEAALVAAKRFATVGDYYGAFSALRRCLAAKPGEAACAALLEAKVRPALLRIQPDHIKDIAAYEEGDGYLFYFSLVDKAGSYVSAPGTASLLLTVENGVAMAVTSFDVAPSDFQGRALGPGLFARPALIVSRLISRAELTSGFQLPPGLGEVALQQLTKDGSRAHLELQFTDALGKVHRARTSLFF